MRASRTLNSRHNLRDGQEEIHISGAEGLYELPAIQGIVKKYIERAFTHPKGEGDKIMITIEDIKKEPKVIEALPVTTVHCESPAESRRTITMLLRSLGISQKAIAVALALVKKGGVRGAAIVTCKRGDRLEPDRERGVRVSRMGINPTAHKILSLRLSRRGIKTDTVKEALMLASKVISCRDVIAELCISDDPNYTTGYVASKAFGYLRIPHIKPEKSGIGGRAFFVREDSNIGQVIEYLEGVPVLIAKIDLCRGTLSIDEILNRSHQ